MLIRRGLFHRQHQQRIFDARILQNMAYALARRAIGVFIAQHKRALCAQRAHHFRHAFDRAASGFDVGDVHRVMPAAFAVKAAGIDQFPYGFIRKIQHGFLQF